jgi:hypothetical protein
MLQKSFGYGAILMCGHLFAATALAQETAQNCLKVSETRQIEERHIDAQGHATVKLKDAATAARGEVVRFTLQAINGCAAALDPAVIDFALPERVTYLLGTATSAAASDITYSINGKTYGRFDALAIHDSSGPRPARAEDIKSIRWVFRKPLAPQSSRSVRFRASKN